MRFNTFLVAKTFACMKLMFPISGIINWFKLRMVLRHENRIQEIKQLKKIYGHDLAKRFVRIDAEADEIVNKAEKDNGKIK